MELILIRHGLPARRELIVDDLAECDPNFTSMHRVSAFHGGHRNVISMNETSHLRGAGLSIGMVQRG